MLNHFMTDIHQHVLWGVDDGAQTPQVMCAMLEQAHAQNIRAVVATAHAAPGYQPFDIGRYRERLSQAQDFCTAQKLNVQVVPGAEIAWTYQTASALRQKRVPAIGDTDYVLLELWPDISWQAAKDAVCQITRAGYCPILAHVERYRIFTLSPKAAMRFRTETGALFQLNGDTLLNPRGILQRRFCRVLLSGRAIDVVATDAHDCEARPVNLATAYSWLLENTDETYARDLTTFGEVLK